MQIDGKRKFVFKLSLQNVSFEFPQKYQETFFEKTEEKAT